MCCQRGSWYLQVPKGPRGTCAQREQRGSQGQTHFPHTISHPPSITSTQHLPSLAGTRHHRHPASSALCPSWHSAWEPGQPLGAMSLLHEQLLLCPASPVENWRSTQGEKHPTALEHRPCKKALSDSDELQSRRCYCSCSALKGYSTVSDKTWVNYHEVSSI